MKSRFRLIGVVSLAILATTAPAFAQLGPLEVLYVPNRESDTISVVDIDPSSPTRYEVIHTIQLPAGVKPTSVVATSGGRKAFVVASFDGVYPINTRDLVNPVGTIIMTGESPLAARMAPDDSVVFVTNLLSDTMSVIDTVTNQVVNTAIFDNGLGFPSYPLGMATNGNELWVSVQFPGRIERFSADRGIVHLGTIPLPGTVPFFPPLNMLPLFPVDVAFADGGGSAYAPLFQSPGFGVPDGFAVIGVSAGPCMIAGEIPPCVVQQVDSTTDPDIGAGAAEVAVPNLVNNPSGLVWVTNFGPVDEEFFPSGTPLTSTITLVNPADVNDPANTTRVPTGGLSPGGIARSRPQDEVFVVNVFAGDDQPGSVAVFDAGNPFGGLKDLGAKANPITGGSLGEQIGFYPVTPFALQIPGLPAPPVFDAASPCGQSIPAKTEELASFTVTATFTAPFFDTVTMDVGALPGTATMTPTLPTSGAGIVTSTFDWTPVVGDELSSPYVVTFTATGVYGRTSNCAVTINVVKPPDPGDLVEFDDFHVKVKIHKRIDYFKTYGLFRLSEEFSDGIDPANEELVLTFEDPDNDTFELVIPAGSFRRLGHRNYKFYGTVDGVKVFAWLRRIRGNKWYFNIRGWRADIDALDNNITTTLQIGDDFGTKTGKAWIWPRH